MISPISKVRSRQQGLTLIEAVISIVILFIAGMALVSFLQTITLSSRVIEDRADAHQIMNQIHSHLLKHDFKALENHYSEFPQIIRNSRFKADVTIEEPPQNQKTRLATIEVEWTTRREIKSLTREVLLISYGLPN